jgi:hypothetical protein
LETVPKELFSIVVTPYTEEPFSVLTGANYWHQVVASGRRQSGSSAELPNQKGRLAIVAGIYAEVM